MKSLLLPVFFFFLLIATSCSKKGEEVTPAPPPPPPPVMIEAEIVIRFGAFPEDMLDLAIFTCALVDADSNFIGTNFADEDGLCVYPEFSIKVPKDIAEAYFGKPMGIFIGACRGFPPGVCWGMEEIVMFETLGESQEAYFEIPGRD